LHNQLHVFKIYVHNNSRTINTNACGKLRVLLRFSSQHIFHKVGRNFAARCLPADVLLFFGIEGWRIAVLVEIGRAPILSEAHASAAVSSPRDARANVPMM
jgi:hypothetical protein